MARGWNLKLIRPADVVRVAVYRAWAASLSDLQQWIQTDLVHAMVYGGLGLQGIADTPFYKFVVSPEGLSQLGIEKTEPPKLLQAYVDTVKVSKNNTLLKLQFGDVALLKIATPHPASGTGHLQIESWLEWVVDKETVQSGYVPRNKLPRSIQKNIRVKSAPGGLMLGRGQFGSTGLWRFPTQLADFERRWLSVNIAKIEKLIQTQLIMFLTKRLS